MSVLPVSRPSPLYNPCTASIATCRSVARTLVHRASIHWRSIPPMANVAIAVYGCILALFRYNSYCLSGSFLILAVVSGFCLYEIQRQSTLHSLQTSVGNLQTIENAFFFTAEQLREQNNVLKSLNEDLSDTNDSLQKTNGKLLTTNQSLDEQVARLTLQVTQLTSSASQIQEGLTQFQSENHDNRDRLNESIRQFGEQITTARALSDQTATLWIQQNQNLGEQFQALRTFFGEIQANGATLSRLQELNTLNEQLRTTSNALHTTQAAHAAELGRLEGIRSAFEQVNSELLSTNTSLSTNVAGLGEVRTLFQRLLERLQPIDR